MDSVIHRDLLAHIERVEHENEHERFFAAPRGAMALAYSLPSLRKSVKTPGWARVWTVSVDGNVVAHASAYDSGERGYVLGHISVEGPQRGQRIAAKLQAERGRWLDEHELALIGPVAAGNHRSMAGCLASGFESLRIDETGAAWVVRWPNGKPAPVHAELPRREVWLC